MSVRWIGWRCAGKVVDKVVEYLSPKEVQQLLLHPSLHPNNCSAALMKKTEEMFRKLEALRERAGVVALRAMPSSSLPKLLKHHQTICILTVSTKASGLNFAWHFADVILFLFKSSAAPEWIG